MPSTLGIVASGYDFTPLDLSPLAWWDASDASTFTYSSGTSVSQWTDKTTNAWAAVQATAASQPSRSGTVNGLSTVVFDGSNDSLSVSSFNMSGGQKFTLAMVTSCVSGNDRVFAEHTTNYNATPGAWIVYRANTNVVAFAKRGGGNYATFDSSASLTTTPRIIFAEHDGTLSTDESSMWIDSSNSGTRPINNNTNANNLNATMYVGARAGTGLYLNGQIAEFIVTTSILTAAQRVDLQTYLAAKWGITL